MRREGAPARRWPPTQHGPRRCQWRGRGLQSARPGRCTCLRGAAGKPRHGPVPRPSSVAGPAHPTLPGEGRPPPASIRHGWSRHRLRRCGMMRTSPRQRTALHTPGSRRVPTPCHPALIPLSRWPWPAPPIARTRWRKTSPANPATRHPRPGCNWWPKDVSELRAWIPRPSAPWPRWMANRLSHAAAGAGRRRIAGMRASCRPVFPVNSLQLTLPGREDAAHG